MTDELDITVYGHDECAPCKQVKMYLDRKGIPYEYKNARTNSEYLKEMLYYSDNQMIYPVVKTSKGTMVGFSMQRLVEII